MGGIAAALERLTGSVCPVGPRVPPCSLTSKIRTSTYPRSSVAKIWAAPVTDLSVRR